MRHADQPTDGNVVKYTAQDFRAHDEQSHVSITLNHRILCQYTKESDGTLVVGFKDASVAHGFWPSWFPCEAAVVDWLIEKLITADKSTERL